MSGKTFDILKNKVFYKLGSSNDSDIATAVLAGFKLFFIPFATMSDKKASKEQKEYAAARDFLTEAIALTTYIGVTKMFKMHGTTPLCTGYYKRKAKLIKEGKMPNVDPKMFSEADYNALENIDKKSFKSVMLDKFHRSKDKGKATIAEKKYVENLTNIVRKFEVVSPENPVVPTKFFAKLNHTFKNLSDPTSKIQLPENLYKNTKINISQICIWTLAVFVIPPMCNFLLKPVLAKFKAASENSKKGPKKLDTVQAGQIAVVDVKKPETKDSKKPTFSSYYNSGNIGNMRVGM